MGVFLPQQWKLQPQFATRINSSGRLFNPAAVSVLLNPGGHNFFDLKSGVRYAPGSTVPSIVPTSIGKGYQWTLTDANSYLTINSDADNVLDTVNCTMIVASVRQSSSTHAGASHGYSASATDRVLVHLPFTDNNCYWDFGNSTAGAGGGRLSVSISSFTAAGTVNIWGFVAGSRGREIWRNGVRLASDTTATLTRSATTAQFNVGACLPTGGNSPPSEITTAFFLSKQELAPAAVAELTANPWQMFQPLSARIYSFPTAAGGSTVPVLYRQRQTQGMAS